mgnify:CR=1 FL=1
MCGIFNDPTGGLVCVSCSHIFSLSAVMAGHYYPNAAIITSLTLRVDSAPVLDDGVLHARNSVHRRRDSSRLWVTIRLFLFHFLAGQVPLDTQQAQRPPETQISLSG